MERKYVFEIYLDGFLSWSNVTDELIKWIEAPNIRVVTKFIEENKIALQNGPNLLTEQVTDGIDVVLNKNGTIASGEEELSRWENQIEAAKEYYKKIREKFEQKRNKEKEDEEELNKWVSRSEKKKKKREAKRLAKIAKKAQHISPRVTSQTKCHKRGKR